MVKTLNITKSFNPGKKNVVSTLGIILNKTAKWKLRKKQKLWKQHLKTKDTKPYTDVRKISNPLRHLARKSSKEKEGNISDQAKTNQNVFASM